MVMRLETVSQRNVNYSRRSYQNEGGGLHVL